MNKPLSVAMEETKKIIASALSGSGLSYWLMRYVLADLMAEVDAKAAVECQRELAEYQKSLKEEKEAGDELHAGDHA